MIRLRTLFACAASLGLACASYPEYMAEADFNSDGDVDADDLFIVAKNYTGSLDTGTGGKTFEEGDTDTDEDVDDFDAIAAMVYQTGPIGPAPTTGAFELIYNQADGTLTIDTKGGSLYGYAIEDDDPTSLNVIPPDTGNLVIGPMGLLLTLYTGNNSPWGPAQSSIITAIHPDYTESGVIELGARMPAGLTETEFLAHYDHAKYASTPNGFDYSFTPVYVPEPASLGLLLIGTACVVRRRR